MSRSRRRGARRRAGPPPASGRRTSGWLVAMLGPAALTAVLLPLRDHVALSSVLLLSLLGVLAAASIGGLGPSLTAALLGFVLANWFFTPPLHTWKVEDFDNLLALGVLLAVGGVVSWYGSTVSHRSAEVARARAGTELRNALLAAVSHDLRTPLASIKASVTSLLADDVDWPPEVARQFCTTIDHEVDRRVLVVEDEPQMQRALTTNLRARGYEVDEATSGEQALELAARRHPDVVVLDLGLPGIDGIDVVHGLRGWTTVPILVLSARDDEASKVEALDVGADDYVTKPFGMDELLARLRAALRRGTPAAEEPMVSTADFVVDLAAKRVTRGTRTVHLTPTEWQVVEVLVRNPGKLVSQRQLLAEVWGPQYRTETNYLRLYLAQIRRKLEPEPSRPRYFLTEPGMGYRFQP